MNRNSWWEVCPLARAFELLEEENKKLLGCHFEEDIKNLLAKEPCFQGT